MVKAKYIETIPRKHTKIFSSKQEAFKYWNKRCKRFYSNNPNVKPFSRLKDYFDGKTITLNKDGKPRKQYVQKPITEKNRKSYLKAMKNLNKKRRKEINKRNKERIKMEEKLEYALHSLGYNGKINIKFFSLNKIKGGKTKMAYVVTAKVSRGGSRTTSMKFRTRAEAESFAKRTARDRPGSNPRIKRV
jgi:hypothetical protein|tara:strand:- start:58 stop:624 length:567 start_codon:yes stop_codon:yes gene_type:complete